MSSAQESMQTIESFLDQVGAQPEKKAAEANTEAGGYDGATTHPVKDVDDRTEDADEGARSSENSEDTKDDKIGPGKPSVDATSEAKAKVGADEGTAASDQTQIGTNKQPTGDDPSNETQGTKPGKEDGQYDGPSTHPARTDNNELDGNKYSADLSGMSIAQLAKEAADLGNEICADIANEATTAKQAMDKCPGCKEDKGSCKCGMYGKDKYDKSMHGKDKYDKSMHGKDEYDKEAGDQLSQQVGWEMAGLVTGNFDKKAADSMVHSALKDVVKTASDDADNVVEYLSAYDLAEKEAAEKAAMGGDPLGGMPGGDAGAIPPEALGAAPGAAPALAPAPAGPEGGAPEGGAPEGGAPEGGAPEDEAAMLAAVLDELGVSPEELEAALAAQGGGGGLPGAEAPAGPAPAGGEGDEEAGAMEAQASAGATKKAGDPTTEEKKAEMKNYISEIVTRSRQKRAADKAKKDTEAAKGS